MPGEVLINAAKLDVSMKRIVMLAIRSVDSFYKAAEDSIKEVYLRKLEANVMLQDHTLKVLAELDHPYATRHGAIQVGALGHEGWKVHQQTQGLAPTFRLIPEKSLMEIKEEIIRGAVSKGGIYTGSKIYFTPEGPGNIYLSWKIVSDSIITGYVEFGTNKMLPRPFAEETIRESISDMNSYLKSRFRLAK